MQLHEAVLEQLTPDRVAYFEEHQFLVLPVGSVADAPCVGALHEDLVHCFDKVAKIPNQVEFLLPSGPVQLTKPDVFECDLHNDAHRAQLPSFTTLLDVDVGRLAAGFRALLPSLSDLATIDGTDAAKRHTTVKLQMNAGGSFPWHYDNPGRPNKRRLTMGVYLTPHWAPTNGGSLLLQPFLGATIAIPPSMCTVVLFRSDTILHAVEPFHATTACRTRYCFTIWFDGTNTNTDDEVNLRAKHLVIDALPLLKRSPLQRVLSRVVYDEAYRQRLMECFGGKDARDTKISLALHDAHIKPLLANKDLSAFVEVLRGMRSDV